MIERGHEPQYRNIAASGVWQRRPEVDMRRDHYLCRVNVVVLSGKWPFA